VGHQRDIFFRHPVFSSLLANQYIVPILAFLMLFNKYSIPFDAIAGIGKKKGPKACKSCAGGLGTCR
jgi:hypothetical protein